jgi:DoxX-like family
MESATQSVSKASLWAGRIISTLVVLFLLFDAVAKLMRIAPVLQAFTQLGFSTSLAVPIGAVLLVSTVLYVIPSTAILGAILLAAYLGGATVTHLRAGQPFYFPIIFGALVWGGLYLREDRLRALIPLRSPNVPSQAQ